MHFLSTLWTLLPSLSLILTTSALPHNSRNHALAVHNITQFPNGTFVQKLAIRSNGQALVTLLNTPELHLVDPDGGGSQLIHQFPEVTALLGIAEVEDDVFAVVAGNFSLKTAQSTPGSYSVWKVDMKPFNTPSSPAVVTKITAIPQASLLNGITVLDGNGNVLISDSMAGVVYRLDTHSGNSQIVIDDPLMKPPAGAPVAVGVNGLNIFNNVLYFTNSFAFTFNRVPINPDGTPSGAVQTVVQCPFCDDFTLDHQGNAFVAQNGGNALLKIAPDGTSMVLLGSLNSTELAGPTCPRFGRKGQEDSSILYVATCGGLAGPVNGTFVEGGKVVSIDFHG